MSPQYVAAAVKSLYEAVGVDIQLEGVTVQKRTFDATTIASRLGMTALSGNPHGQAVSVIISMLGINENERELVPFQNSLSGHSGESVRYTESVLDKVAQWLEDNGYPEEIKINGKTYRVKYTKVNA